MKISLAQKKKFLVTPCDIGNDHIWYVYDLRINVWNGFSKKKKEKKEERKIGRAHV